MAKKSSRRGSIDLAVDQAAADPLAGQHQSCAETDVAVEEMFGSLIDEVSKETGRSDIMGAEVVERMIMGLPLPALSLAFLYQNTALPLGRVISFVAEEGSCKTPLLHEHMRWNLMAKGANVLIENENKGGPDLLNSILGYNRNWMARTAYDPSDSLEDWMESLTTWTKKINKMCTGHEDNPVDDVEEQKWRKEGKGTGWKTPFFLGIDSFMATGSRNTIEKIEREGAPRRSHPEEALLISLYFKTLASKLRDKPIIIAGTNHMKPSTNQQGLPVANIPGGKSIKFAETFRVELSKGAKIDLTDKGGVKVYIRTAKNALGQTGRGIEVNFMWTRGIVNDKEVQLSWWDWNAATIDLLLKFKAKNVSIWNHINEIVDIHPVSGRRAWSKALGFDGSAEAVPYSKLGAALEARPDLVVQLYSPLRIKPRHVWIGGDVDYRDAIKAAKHLADVQIAPYVPAEDLSQMSELSDELEAIETATESDE